MKTPLQYPPRYQNSKSLPVEKGTLGPLVKIRNRLLLPTLSAGLLLFGPDGAAAATLTVTNTANSGAGSLRQAILDAASGDTINFSLPANSTITLTSGELFIAKDVLTIAGPGADTLTVQRSTAAGTSNFGVFDIGGQSNVTISGLTISNGNNTGNDGGGILNQSTKPITLSDCVIIGNSTSTGLGGGLSNRGTMTVTNCTFTGNSSTGGGNGGGVENEGTMDVINSTVLATRSLSEMVAAFLTLAPRLSPAVNSVITSPPAAATAPAFIATALLLLLIAVFWLISC